jgi:hypothetical protein
LSGIHRGLREEGIRTVEVVGPHMLLELGLDYYIVVAVVGIGLEEELHNHIEADRRLEDKEINMRMSNF